MAIIITGFTGWLVECLDCPFRAPFANQEDAQRVAERHEAFEHTRPACHHR